MISHLLLTLLIETFGLQCKLYTKFGPKQIDLIGTHQSSQLVSHKRSQCGSQCGFAVITQELTLRWTHSLVCLNAKTELSKQRETVLFQLLMVSK